MAEQLSPMMQSYVNKKAEYQDCILFYRLGDFYEMFYDDAITASRELEITLTAKACGTAEKAPMCGVPYHAAEIYISRLIAKGYKVAICEQLSDPKTTKGLVERDVVRVVTPGTVMETNMLEEKKNNYIMSIVKDGLYYGLAICDISTGDFYSTQIKLKESNFEKLLDEYARYEPTELVVNEAMSVSVKELDTMKDRANTFVSNRKDDIFKCNKDMLLKLYTVTDADDREKEDLDGYELSVRAINGLLEYFTETQKIKLEHINRIKLYEVQKYMALDINARRSLELTEIMRDKSKKGTLIWILDKTSTSMGGRLLRRWINDPLLDIEEIKQRHEAVRELKDNLILREELKKELSKVYDLERLSGKIAFGSVNAREMNSLKNSLMHIPAIKENLSFANSKLLKNLYGKLDELQDIVKLIDDAIVDDPPITVKDGGIIKDGYNLEIDEYKRASVDGKNWIIELEAREKELTGIKNLKVGYTSVFGYYIEVTKSFLSQVPENRYIRKQTLTNAERFITEELRDMESKILGAQEKAIKLEYEEFVKIRNEITKNIERLQLTASIVSSIDVLSSLATVAEDNNYIEPQMNNEGILDIKDGRHPVIEKMIENGTFVQNDTYLDKDD